MGETSRSVLEIVLSYVSQYYSTNGYPPHRPPAFGTRRRGELFDALLTLFLAEGFAHLTLDDIAARLRCSKGTLYTLAGSKEQLVHAVTVHFFRRATDDVEQRVSAASGARERITAYLTAVGAALEVASERFMTDLGAFTPPLGRSTSRTPRSPPVGSAS